MDGIKIEKVELTFCQMPHLRQTLIGPIDRKAKGLNLPSGKWSL
jgi:hypothetical protein